MITTHQFRASKGWYSRGYLPHYDQPELFQVITFRLWDSLPQVKLIELNDPRLNLTELQKRNRVDVYLDKGWGSCLLRDPRTATIMQETLLHFDNKRYNLLAWVVMPNHVHAPAQFMEGFPLSKVLHSWKSFAAHEFNNLLGRKGPLFQRDYHDRCVRSEEHYARAIEYIEYNPVKAGLVSSAADWPFSSAKFRQGW